MIQGYLAILGNLFAKLKDTQINMASDVRARVFHLGRSLIQFK